MASNMTLDEIVRGHLEEWDVVSACQEVSKAEYQEWISEHGWVKLVAVVVVQLTAENWSKCPQIFAGCQEILCHVAKVGKPKEVLIALSEHCEAFQDDVKVEASNKLFPCRNEMFCF